MPYPADDGALPGGWPAALRPVEDGRFQAEKDIRAALERKLGGFVAPPGYA